MLALFFVGFLAAAKQLKTYISVADPEGVRLNPAPHPHFKISYENEIIWSQ